jgi:tripartite-type tricarboxylate transporter receptor subunit TctC
MMHFPARRAILGAASAVTLLALTACGNVSGGSADSSKYPNGPVNLTVGQAPGGSTDLIARAISEGAAKTLGAPMPVVNKPGANGALASKEVAGKPADGQNLLLINASKPALTAVLGNQVELATIQPPSTRP